MQSFVDTCVDFEVPICPEIAIQDCPILKGSIGLK